MGTKRKRDWTDVTTRDSVEKEDGPRGGRNRKCCDTRGQKDRESNVEGTGEERVKEEVGVLQVQGLETGVGRVKRRSREVTGTTECSERRTLERRFEVNLRVNGRPLKKSLQTHWVLS